MGSLPNEFGWSASRGNLIEECERAYFWSYYGGWHGWEKWAPAETRIAYRLKKLSNRWSWSGDVVHMVIRRALGDYRAGRSVDPAPLIQGAQEAMRLEWKASKKGPRTAKNSRGFWGLLEHEYREEVPAEEWRKIWARTENALRSFFASRLPAEFAGLSAERWIEIDSAGAGGAPPTFDFEGTRVFAIPDLVVGAERGGVVVYDWKTGRPKPSDRDQVLGYALYLADRYKLDPSTVYAKAVYLGDGAREEVFATDVEELDRYRATLRAGIARARTFLVDGDTKRNKPLPIARFAQTEDRGTCARCAFRRLCDR